MNDARFDRNVRLFGEDGQRQIRATTCAVVGVGGLGTLVVQVLSLLGVGGLKLIDSEEVDVTNRNRYVGVRHDDPLPGTKKIDVGEQLAHIIDPEIRVQKIHGSFVSTVGYTAIRESDFVFGCLDLEGARLILTEVCAAYSRPYIDLATDVIPGESLEFGGRVCFSRDGDGCPAASTGRPGCSVVIRWRAPASLPLQRALVTSRCPDPR